MSGRLQLYVLCWTRSSGQIWRSRVDSYPDLEISVLHAVASPLETLRGIARQAGRPFLVCREDVYLGMGIGAQVELLIGELNERFPNWAVCGNRGVRWDGQQVYDFSYDINSAGLQTAVCAHPVISVDENVLLVNAEALTGHQHCAPPLSHRRFGVVLALECLRNGSLAAVSPRLMAVRSAAGENSDEGSLDADPEFCDYYRSSFLNHQLSTADGTLNLGEIVDYSYLSEPWIHRPQKDVLDLYDLALQQARSSRQPSLTICCRTQFRRPEMLDRAVFSFGVFRQEAGSLADVCVQLITDQAAEVGSAELQRLQQAHPAAALQCWRHAVRPGRHSRTDLLISAIERAETDYIWFVDDDDYVNGPAAAAVARCLAQGAPLVVAASSRVVKETWDVPDGMGLELTSAERSSGYDAANVFRILRGHNYIPICSMMLPVSVMQERVRHVRALGDFNEDYFLLLLALTAPRIEVCVLDVEVASISIRGDENTVAQKDRPAWLLSYAAFMLELLNNPEGNSPFLWQLANAPRW